MVRYGNVLSSRGSAIPFFFSRDKKYLPITHKDMTRFFLTLDDAVDFVYFAFKVMTGVDCKKTKFNKYLKIS